MKTDRQTDKATHWLVTGFSGEIVMLETPEQWPPFVKKVYGGREICPTSGREHFQGHIQCNAQQRFSALKKWLPTAHLEVARDAQASMKYAMKEETSSGEKRVVDNPRPFVTDRMALEKLADVCPQFCNCKTYPDKQLCFDDKEDFWHRVREILIAEPDLCGLYGKPDLYRLWNNTKSVWFHRKKTRDSITPSPDGWELGVADRQVSDGGNEIIISDKNINGATVPEEESQEDQDR